VEAQALYARGWTKSAIARHLGINRRTVREYLKGQQVPGQRVRSEPEVFAPFAEYARLRLHHITTDPKIAGSNPAERTSRPPDFAFPNRSSEHDASVSIRA